MPSSDWECFRELVLHDHALQQQLRETPDWTNFLALVLRLGAERGFRFAAADVEHAMHAARRAWLERWL